MQFGLGQVQNKNRIQAGPDKHKQQQKQRAVQLGGRALEILKFLGRNRYKMIQ